MYHFIVNPHARTGQGAIMWKEVKKILEEKKVEYDVTFTKRCNHAQDLVRAICTADDSIKNIVVMGGDGTVNEVINGIPDYDKVILSYIPLGSGNDLARGLKLGTDPVKNLARTLHPSTYRYVDHGVIEGEHGKKRTFAVSSSIGYDASVCYEVANSKLKRILNKLKLGKLTYILIAFKQVFTWNIVEMDISIDHAGTALRICILIAVERHAHSSLNFSVSGALPSTLYPMTVPEKGADFYFSGKMSKITFL